MNCMKCGAPAGNAGICPRCGQDLSVQKKALQLSVAYYNQGLDKAQIRDLSGAIDMLQRSLKYNKLNIPARNLLGLVYFETGEAVSALSEWIISKNIKPENNIASEYIQRVQAEPAKLDTINQTIKKYNIALKCCREGNDDVAVIQLKKILTQNPKLIKAYHLLALLYIKRKAYEKARKILKKAAKIDKTNSTTLRFLKEVDEQTGTVTSLEGRRNSRRKKDAEGQEQEKSVLPDREAYISDGEMVIQPASVRESSVLSTIINIVTGIVIGALVVWFLAVPSVRRSVNREADEKIVEYSSTTAAQEAQIQSLQNEIETSNSTVESAQQQITQATNQVSAYERLVTAMDAYQDQDYEAAATALTGLDSSLLSADSREIYDAIYGEVQNQMFDTLSEDGMEALNDGDYDTAVDLLEQARKINGDDYDVLSSLATAYRLSGDSANAVSVYQEIAEKFPGRRAVAAQSYIEQLNGTGTAGNAGTGADTGSAADNDGSGAADEDGDGAAENGTGTADGTGETGDTGTGTDRAGDSGAADGQEPLRSDTAE